MKIVSDFNILVSASVEICFHLLLIFFLVIMAAKMNTETELLFSVSKLNTTILMSQRR